MLNNIKAVLFDLDGTLIDTIEDLTDATNYALSLYGYKNHTNSEIKAMVGNGIRTLVQRALPEEKRFDSEIDKVFIDFMSYYKEHSVDKTKPYDGVPQVVKEIMERGIKTAVVTNKDETAAKAILNQLYPNCFDLIIGQRDSLPAKPDPAAALLAMETLGVKPNECVFVGDSGVDIETAVNSGAYPVGVLWGFRDAKELKDNGAKSIISEPDALLKLLFD